MMTHSRNRLFAFVFCALLMMAFAAPAAGQLFVATAIDNDDLEEYRALHTLSDAQFKAFESHYRQYLEQWQQWDRDVMRPFEERVIAQVGVSNTERLTGEQIAERVRQFDRQAERFDEALFEAVRPMLTDEQVARFPIVERLRHRDRLLERCRIGPVRYPVGGEELGMLIDLRRRCRALGVTASERTAIEPLLEAYELDLAARLKKYNEAIVADRWNTQRRGGKFPDIWQPLVDVSAPIFRMHRQWAEQIAESLAPDRAEALLQDVVARLYPGPEPDAGRLHLHFDRLESADLTAAQSRTLAELREQYLADHRELSRAIWELMDAAVGDVHFWIRGVDQDHDKVRTIRRAIKDRSSLNEQTRLALRELLGIDRFVAADAQVDPNPMWNSMSSLLRLPAEPLLLIMDYAGFSFQLNDRVHFVAIKEHTLFEPIPPWLVVRPQETSTNSATVLLVGADLL